MCRGWSRVLYSTQVKLFPWIPEFVISILTNTALLEVRSVVASYMLYAATHCCMLVYRLGAPRV